MEFASKGYFLLLLLLIPYILWYFLYRRKNEPTMRMSDTKQYLYAPKSLRVRLIHLPMFLRCVSFVLIVCAMARPQTHNSWDNKTVEGINIMLAMDVSTSMLAEDLKPNRMEAAKDVAHEFISGRPNDNIGLTIFAGEAFTQCPMTTDHSSLLRLLQDTRTDIAARGLIQDGTAVGMGLANAVSRLKDSKSKSKVVILQLLVIGSSIEITIGSLGNILQSLRVYFHRNIHVLNSTCYRYWIWSNLISTDTNGIYSDTQTSGNFCSCHRRNITHIITTISQKNDNLAL